MEEERHEDFRILDDSLFKRGVSAPSSLFHGAGPKEGGDVLEQFTIRMSRGCLGNSEVEGDGEPGRWIRRGDRGGRCKMPGAGERKYSGALRQALRINSV